MKNVFKRYILITGLCSAILLIASLPALTLAAPVTLPPRPTPTLAPAPPPDGGGAPGAYIELPPLQNAPAGVWIGVQWQNELGNWYDVEGWQGTPDAGGGKRWWVAPRDFGTGPFRWVISARQGGPALGASTPFNLPSAANETVRTNDVIVAPPTDRQ